MTIVICCAFSRWNAPTCSSTVQQTKPSTRSTIAAQRKGVKKRLTIQVEQQTTPPHPHRSPPPPLPAPPNPNPDPPPTAPSNTQVVHMLKYQAPVLALALAPDNSSLVAATTDRTLTIRRRDLRHAAALAARGGGVGGGGVGAGGIGGSGIGGIGGIGGEGMIGSAPRSVRTGTARYFNRGKTEAAGQGDVKVGCCLFIFSGFFFFPVLFRWDFGVVFLLVGLCWCCLFALLSLVYGILL